MNADRHHLRRPRAFGIEHVERIFHRLQPAVGNAEARCHRELHVVHFQRVRDDEMRRAIHFHPIGKVVAVAVARIEEAAMLHHGAQRFHAEAASVPADRWRAGGIGDRLHRLPDMVEFLLEREVLVVDPAIAVARDLVPSRRHGPARGGVQLESAPHRPGGEVQPTLIEQAQDAPEARPAAVFVHRLGGQVAAAHDRRTARRLGQEHFRGGIAVQDRVLAPLFVVQNEGDGDPRLARPLRIGRVRAVPDQVAFEVIVH